MAGGALSNMVSRWDSMFSRAAVAELTRAELVVA